MHLNKKKNRTYRFVAYEKTDESKFDSFRNIYIMYVKQINAIMN